MAIIDFTPEALVLSTGEKTAMYTARFVGVFTSINSYGQKETFRGTEYITNLSTDRDTAIQKLGAIATQYNLPYSDSADFDLNEIKRDRDQMKAERAIEIERQLREREEKAEQLFNENVVAGLMIGGKYAGLTAQQISEKEDGIDYLQWLAKNQITKNYFGVLVKLAQDWLAANPQPVSDWCYIDEIGSTQTTELKIKKAVWFDGFYGRSCRVDLVDRYGNLFLCYTTSKKVLDTEPKQFHNFTFEVKELQGSDIKVTVIKKIKIAKKGK